MVDLKRLQDAMQREDVVEIAEVMGWSFRTRGDYKKVHDATYDQSTGMSSAGVEVTRMHIDCVVCGKEIPQEPDGFLERCARITRGDFRFDEDGDYDYGAENVKFERYLCLKCFLEDEHLCMFFNKLGLRIR